MERRTSGISRREFMKNMGSAAVHSKPGDCWNVDARPKIAVDGNSEVVEADLLVEISLR